MATEELLEPLPAAHETAEVPSGLTNLAKALTCNTKCKVGGQHFFFICGQTTLECESRASARFTHDVGDGLSPKAVRRDHLRRQRQMLPSASTRQLDTSRTNNSRRHSEAAANIVATKVGAIHCWSLQILF